MPSETGFLTAISGQGALAGESYEKTFTHRIDGLLSRATLNVQTADAQKALVQDFEYYDDGSVREVLTNVVSPQTGIEACLNEGIRKDLIVDGLGRPVELDVNQQPLAVVGYDSLDRVQSVQLSDGSFLTPGYDGYTLAQSGFSRLLPNNENWQSSFAYDNRGNVSTEVQGSALGQTTRSYGYSPEGNLVCASDASECPPIVTTPPASTPTYSYSFDGSALPSSTSVNGVAQTLPSYIPDSLGEVTTRTFGGSTATYTYDPSGQIAHVDSPSGSADYVYDESGLRIAKEKSGALTLYTDAGVLDASGLTEPMDMAGVHIGVLTKGTAPNQGPLVALATDIRGTVLSAPTTSGGTTNSLAPSPFGARQSQPSVSNVTSYIEQPFDADLGVTRLGVRDYDQDANRFLQPDPLYLQNPGACRGDHVGCNLYSYSGNNPSTFMDPQGLVDDAKTSVFVGDGSSPDPTPPSTDDGSSLWSTLRSWISAANSYVNANTNQSGGNLGGPAASAALGGLGGGNGGLGGGGLSMALSGGAGGGFGTPPGRDAAPTPFSWKPGSTIDEIAVPFLIDLSRTPTGAEVIGRLLGNNLPANISGTSLQNRFPNSDAHGFTDILWETPGGGTKNTVDWRYILQERGGYGDILGTLGHELSHAYQNNVLDLSERPEEFPRQIGAQIRQEWFLLGLEPSPIQAPAFWDVYAIHRP